MDDNHMALVLTRKEAAHMVNLLADNARPWNSLLRAKCAAFVTATETFNARLEAMGAPDGSR